MANRNELFDERERLIKNNFLPKINKITEKISWIRSKLYELGVPLEDC